MTFEWDDSKEESNLRKHGIDFSTVKIAFKDPRRVFNPNRRSSTESRFQCIGFDGTGVLTITFTLRKGAVRAINAGYFRKGRKLYEKQS